MKVEIAKLENYLKSDNNLVRLKAIKMLLRHPQATPLQIVECLCSEDLMSLGDQEVFELDWAIHDSWERIRSVDDEEVYEYLDTFFLSNSKENVWMAIYILELINTKKAIQKLKHLRQFSPSEFYHLFDQAIQRLSIPGSITAMIVGKKSYQIVVASPLDLIATLQKRTE